MKTTVSLLIALVWVLPCVVAQTNTFPSSGNVGIGSVSTNNLLQLQSNNSSNALQFNTATYVGSNQWGTRLYKHDDGGGIPLYCDQQLGSTWNTIFRLGSNGADASQVETYGQTDLATAGGNVGIGTTSPGALLELQANTGAGIEGDLLRINAVSGGAGNGGGILFANNNDVLNLARIAGLDGGNWGGQLVFYTAPGTGSSPGGTPTERMRITSSGNVGIGTTAPSQMLTVSGGNALIDNSASGATTLRLSHVGSGVGSGFLTDDGQGSQMFSLVRQPGNTLGISSYGSIGLSAGANGGPSTSYQLYLNSAGNVGIGTTNPTYPLSVNGTVEAKEVIVQTGWSDYVFDRSYRLAPLSEVESYIKTEHHLPGVPSEKQVAAKGVSLGDMQSKLLAQIEQLTLHVIDQEKEIQELRMQISTSRHESAKLNDSITP